jgi:hypothetical protein
MKTVLIALFPVLFLILSSSHHPADREEWISLFNGENLEGWDIKIAGYELNDNFNQTFRVEDGLLKVSYDDYESWNGELGHIFYEEPFSHYKLVVEYRFVGDQAAGGPDWGYRNNGIMMHSQPAESMALYQNFPISVEMQLLGGDGINERTNGNIYTPGTEVKIDGEWRTDNWIEADAGTYHGDQWVRAETVVLGDSLIQHILDDRVVIEYSKPRIGGSGLSNYDPDVKTDGTPLTEGHIALQAESHPTHFRKIKLLNLKGCMDPDARNFKSYYKVSAPSACDY